MSQSLLIGVACPATEERDLVVAALATAGMDVERLVEACRVDSDIAGRGIDCVVADGALLKNGFLASLRKHDARLPIVALVDPADVDAPLFRRGVLVLTRPIDLQSLALTVSLAHGEGRQARGKKRRRTPRVPSRAAGVPAAILDISLDGVRLEVSRASVAKLGPQFRLQVPMVALDVVLRRAWVGRATGDVVQCGAMLVDPDPSQRLAWERIMELSAATVALADVRQLDRVQPAAPAAPAEPRLLGRVSQLFASGAALGDWATQLTRGR